MKKIYLFFALVMVMASVNTGVCAPAAEKDRGKNKKEPVISSVVKQVQGEVSNISKRSISIVFERNEETGEEFEMLFPVDLKEIKIEHKRSYGDISQGDTVLVIYREETSDYGDKQEMKAKTDVIRFLKPADASSVYKSKAAVTEEALDVEGLSLKGVK
ncbi:MAG: hypothetical protein WC547_05455 [Candidatus Omnitrophota bacterium]